MANLILKAFDILENPLIILEKSTKKILYSNLQANKILDKIEKYLKIPEKFFVITLEEPKKVYLGKTQSLEEDYILVQLEELKKEKPFSGFLMDIIEELPVIVFFIKDGQIFYVNQAVKSILGLSKEEVLGKSIIKDLLWDLDRPKAEIHCQRVMKGIKESGVIFSLKDGFGRTKSFLWNCYLTYNWEGEPIIVSMALDISEILRITQQLESLHKTQSFSEFLKGLVHDFNNILHTIQLYLNNLRTTPLDKINETVTAIEKTIYSWIDINRLLIDYTKETKELRQKSIDIIEFLKNSFESFQFFLGEEIKLHFNFGFYKRLYTYGDETFWRYIFLNFISNSKDAMEKGDIYIKIDKYRDELSQRNYIKITIKDTGFGIPKEVLPHIFEPFYTTKEKGSGLGLFIVNQHIKKLEGFIEVESEEGLGTTFYVYIPLLSEVSICKVKKEADLKDKVIYLFEDDEEARRMLKDLLEEKGAKVYTFGKGKELLEKPSAFARPDLALIDVNLPDMDGQELAKKLGELFSEIEIFYVTGDIFILSEVSKDRVILKPFKIEELLEKLSKV